jgi:hypothetical protein
MVVEVTWNNLEEGEEFQCGIICIDVVGSSQMSKNETNEDRQKTFNNLHEMVACFSYSRGYKIKWNGDGGLIFSRITNSEDCNILVSSCILLNYLIKGFNADPITGCFLKQHQIRVRICCNQGMVKFSKDPANLQGNAINFIAKNERELVGKDDIVIMPEVYEQLDQVLKEKFTDKLISCSIDNLLPNTILVYAYLPVKEQ